MPDGLGPRHSAADAATRPSGRWRLAAAIVLPTVLGAVGVHGLRSLPLAFVFYAAGGCLALPWLLLGARPFAGHGGLPFAPPARPGGRRGEVLLGVLFGPVFLALYALVRPHLGTTDDYLARVGALGVDLRRPALALAAFAVFNPWLEEWWWRGQATPRCRAAFGARGGLAAVTAGFALYHLVLLGALFPWPLAVLRAALIGAASLLWSQLARARGGWRPTWVAHLAADLAMVALFVRMLAR